MPSRILVVDDEPQNVELIEAILEPEGYRLLIARDGEEALQQFARCQPDLVLLDVMMPRLSGLDVCRQLKGNPDSRLTPVVLVTSLSATEDRVGGLEAGADDFLTKPVDRFELLARVRSLASLKVRLDELERAEAVMLSLAQSIEGKDPYTKGHCDRLSTYSSQLGERIGLGDDEITALRRGGIVHDIGKVAVPDAILLKPGRLTGDEMKVMQEHTVIGEKICAPLKSFRAVLPIIRHHHEKLDGTGYPDGLKGDEIPLTARILQIVDVYDALTTERPYKRAMSPQQALETMKGEVCKGWWDSQLFSEFEGMVLTQEQAQQASFAAAS